MVKKIVFSEKAEKQRLGILEYYFNETKSKEIPAKIYNEINSILSLVQQFSEIGFVLEKDRRVIIKSHYKILYTIEDNRIIVLNIWDTRQDPQNIPL